MKNQPQPRANQKAWVVFSGQTDLAWLRILKPGFRHCFVLLHDGRSWITLDPLSNYTDINIHHLPPEFDLPAWLRSRGHKVVEAKLKQVRKPAPFMLFTCTEAVKRVLGLHERFIITPWQLYRHLTSPGVIPAKAGISGTQAQDSGLRRNDNSSLKGEISWEA